MEGSTLGLVSQNLSLFPIPTPNLRKLLAPLDLQVVEEGRTTSDFI